MFKDHRYNPVPVESAIASQFMLPTLFEEFIKTLSDDQLVMLMDSLEEASTNPLDAVFNWASNIRGEMEEREANKEAWNKGLEALANESNIPY